MINNVVLVGNLGRDPEVKYTSAGMAITTFSLCFNSGKDKNGWINVVCFNKLAETAGQHLSKGAKVGIVGVLDENKWEDNNGNKRSNIQIICNNIEFIKLNKQQNQGQGQNQGFGIPDDLPY